MPKEDSGIEVTIENIDNMIYATRIYIGSDNQGGSDSHFLLDTTTSGIFVTKSNVRGFSKDGIFKPPTSDTYEADKDDK